MSFLQRRIDVQFQLGEGSFGESGRNVVNVRGLRCNATITKAGGVSMTYLELRVYGLTPSLMNQLSTLGKPLVSGRNNIVTVSAGDSEAGVAVAFIGIISEAWADYDGAPDTAFIVSAHTGLLDALKPVPPSSYQGTADAATIIAGMAKQMGYVFENSGVSVQLSNAYFPGDLRTQMYACADAAGINVTIDNDTVAIWPRNGTRGGAVPLIATRTGMVGYPAHTQNGIALTTQYNPSINFGGQVVVETDVTPAAGTWSVFSVGHDLSSEDPNGPWFTHLECSVLGRPLPISSS